MKTPIAFITTVCVLLILNVCSLKAQVYNLNQAAGIISVLNEEYVDEMDMEWNINAGQDSRITFTYIAEIEGACYDYINIYTINSSGVPSLLLTIDAIEEAYGTVTTTISSGRAKVVFVSDYMNSYDCGYKGFKIQFSTSNSYTTPEMIGYQGNTMLYPKLGIGTLEPMEALDVNGNIRANGRIYAMDGYWGNLKIISSKGHIELNPLSSDYAYIKTDRSKFLFDKPIYLLDGTLSTNSTSHLSLQTNGTTRMTILSSNGNVGIGTLTPQVKLHVNGSIRGNSTNGSLRIESNSGYIDLGPQNAYDAHIYTDKGSFVFNKTIYSGTGVFGTLNNNNLIFKTNSNSTRMTILQSNGYVGIGTSLPEYLLDVKGIIRATEVQIEHVDEFADFVFRPDYSLPSLQQVDEFISSKGHLPGIPSEAEVQENGMGLVEMQIKLLQKVEELTLYVIEQEKRALEQEKRIKELEAELKNK